MDLASFSAVLFLRKVNKSISLLIQYSFFPETVFPFGANTYELSILTVTIIYSVFFFAVLKVMFMLDLNFCQPDLLIKPNEIGMIRTLSLFYWITCALLVIHLHLIFIYYHCCFKLWILMFHVLINYFDQPHVFFWNGHTSYAMDWRNHFAFSHDSLE